MGALYAEVVGSQLLLRLTKKNSCPFEGQPFFPLRPKRRGFQKGFLVKYEMARNFSVAINW